MLTLHSVAVDPSSVTWSTKLPSGRAGLLRPLVATDEPPLATFFEGLGTASRLSYDVDEPAAHAAQMCEAIDRYDKLRFILEGQSGTIQGIFEFSFGLPEGDRNRYRSYGLELQPGTDVRFALCIADALQGQGVARLLWPHLTDVARGFGCTRIILWGGVYASNEPALRFYRRLGFSEVGQFACRDEQECIDMIVEC